MKYEISHRTLYRYGESVTLGHNEAHLTPRFSARQRCLSNRLIVLPAPAAMRSWTDFFGNQVTYFTLEEEHRELSITAVSEVEVMPIDEPVAAATPSWESSRMALEQPLTPMDLAASQFTFESPCIRRHPRLAEYAQVSFATGRPLLHAVLDLTDRIFREFKYDPTATSVSTPTLEVFEKRRGVCQDFAHLEIACLRSIGLAASYVSGYLVTDPRPGEAKLVGADASHAWLSIYCPGYGWIDVDPTNNMIPRLRHVTVGWGRDYGDVCPIKGVFLGGGAHTMNVAVDVRPVEGIC